MRRAVRRLASCIGRRVLDKLITCIGLNVHKETLPVALAKAGERSEAREYGKIGKRT